MNNTLENKMQEILLASLPEQTAGMMKKFIDEANTLKATNEELNRNHEKLKKDLQDLNTKHAINLEVLEGIKKELQGFEQKKLELAAKELELRKKELELDLTLAQKDIACAKEISTKYHQFLSTLVKNPVSEEYFFESKYHPGGYTVNKDGTNTYSNSGPVTEERRQKIEKTKPEA